MDVRTRASIRPTLSKEVLEESANLKAIAADLNRLDSRGVRLQEETKRALGELISAELSGWDEEILVYVSGSGESGTIRSGLYGKKFDGKNIPRKDVDKSVAFLEYAQLVKILPRRTSGGLEHMVLVTPAGGLVADVCDDAGD